MLFALFCGCFVFDRERHYLAGWLLSEVSIALDNVNKGVRTKALTTLKDVLTKHELDSRLDNADKRARVAGLYFPLFAIVNFLFFPFFFIFFSSLFFLLFFPFLDLL